MGKTYKKHKKTPCLPSNIYNKEQIPIRTTTLQDASRQEYADDTILGIEIQEPKTLTHQLQNYEIVAQGRQLTIQWEKVKLLSNKPNPMIQQALPTPFDAIEYTRGGTILGAQIHIGEKTPTGSQR